MQYLEKCRGSLPFVTCVKVNVLFKKLTERINLTNSDIIKGPKRNFFSLRDQYETKNVFKGPKDQLSLFLIFLLLIATF
jgi:hypothetical protein